jgi:hypothetical protein
MKAISSESEHLSSSSGRRRPTAHLTPDTRIKKAAKAKIAELETIKKSIVSLFTPPQKVEEKSLTVFLKSKLRIKESFLKKLDTIKSTIIKSLTPNSSQYDPEIGELNIDFLLSIYISIQNNMNQKEGDDSSSIYNLPEAKKDLVEKNKEKDELIKTRIQDIIIESLTVSDKENSKISSYSFIKSLLGAFDQFMRNRVTPISDSQIDMILDYLVGLLDFEESEQKDMEVEESKEVMHKPLKSQSKEDEKKMAKPTSRSKDTRSKPLTSKTEKDEKKTEEPETTEEEEEHLSMVVPAILNFISGYFLSRTPQDIDLTEHRRKRIERRKKIAKKLKSSQNTQKEVGFSLPRFITFYRLKLKTTN